MSHIVIEPLDDGLCVTDGSIVMHATNIQGSLDKRHIECHVAHADGRTIYMPQRVDILNPREIERFTARLAANDPGTDYDKLFSELGIAVDQWVTNTPDGYATTAIDDRLPSTLILSHPDLLALDIPERPVLAGPITGGSLNMVYAERGRGKTRFALGLSTAAAQGVSFLGWTHGPPAGVLYIDGEMPLAGLREIVAQMYPGSLDNLFFLASEYVFRTCGCDLRLTENSHRKVVDRILDEYPRVQLLVIDNISTLFPGISEDKKQDWEPINAWLIQLRHRGLAVLLVHHAGKTGSQRGTSAREDILDNIIHLKAPPDYDPKDGCRFHLHFTKARFATGDAVQTLDVWCVERDSQLSFDYQPVIEGYKAQVRNLLMEDITSPTDIANELGISKGYASKLKKQVENDG